MAKETNNKRVYRSSKASDFQKKISREDEEKIIQTLIEENRIEESDTSQERARKERINKQVFEFRLSLALPVFKKRAENKTPGTFELPERLRRLTLEDIPDLMAAAECSDRDIFEIVMGENGKRAALDWYSEDARNMAEKCDELTEEQRKIVLSKISSLVPNPLIEMNKTEDQPMIRIYRIAKARATQRTEPTKLIKEEQYAQWVLVRLYKSKSSQTDNPANQHKLGSLSDYYKLSLLYSLSPHYVMGYDSSRCILAKNGTTELIMDAFCLLPQEMQKTLVRSVAAVA